MFIPTKKSSDPFEESIYFTTSTADPAGYRDIYKSASVLAMKGLYYIQFDASVDFSSWKASEVFISSANGVLSGLELPTPDYQVYEYDKGRDEFIHTNLARLQGHFENDKSHLERKYIPIELREHFIDKFKVFQESTLIDLYVERLFFDGFLSLIYKRGAPLDVDYFVNDKKGVLRILEIKEKDVSKRDPRGFGMDIRRVESLTKLTQIFNAGASYIVRHINNQSERRFVDWRIIDFEKFKAKIHYSPEVEGGTGMRSVHSSNITKVCRFDNFSELR